MKNLFILISIILSSLNAYCQDSIFDINKIKPKDPNNGIIVIYRTGEFSGALDNYSLLLDGENICKLSNARYFYIEVPKGKHELSAYIGAIQLLQKVTSFELEIESGETYYVSTTIKTSFFSNRLDLSEVTKNTAKRDLLKCSPDNCQERILERKN